jgi:predicted DNA-binding protein (MmcQ/YjbR family)
MGVRSIIQHQAPSIKHPAPSTQHPAPIIHHPSSIIHHPASIIQHPAPSTQHPTMNKNQLSMLNAESFREYCLSLKGVTESFPFDETTLVFKVAGKMFALVSLDTPEFRVNLKCDPERAMTLREEYPDHILPGYHMSKVHWNTVFPAGKIGLALFKELTDHSYDLIVESLPKKTKKEWNL